MGPFIKVDLLHQKDEKDGEYDTVVFTGRDDTPETRDALDKILALLLSPKAQRRGGLVPGNALRIDVRLNKSAE